MSKKYLQSKYGLVAVITNLAFLFVSLSFSYADTNQVNWVFNDVYNILTNVGSSPAIGPDGTIFFKSFSGRYQPPFLYAVHPDGTMKWELSLGTHPDYYAITGSPSISPSGTIYVSAYVESTNSGIVLAVNPDGTEKWRFPITFMPTSIAIGIDEVVYTCSRKYLHAVYPDGTEKWSIQINRPETTTNNYYAMYCVVGPDGTIYVTGVRGLYTQPSGLHAIGPDGIEKWVFSTMGAPNAPSVDSDGTVYFSADKIMYAVNPDGTMKWEFVTNHPITSEVTIARDGTLYFTDAGVSNYEGNIQALNPDGTEKWLTPIDGDSGSCITVGSDDLLYIGLSDPSKNSSLIALDSNGTPLWGIDLKSDNINTNAVTVNGSIQIKNHTIYAVSGNGGLYSVQCSSRSLADSAWPFALHDSTNTSNNTGPFLELDHNSDGVIDGTDLADFAYKYTLGLFTPEHLKALAGYFGMP